LGFCLSGMRKRAPLSFGWRLMIIQKLERGLFGGKTMETLEVLWVVDSVVGDS